LSLNAAACERRHPLRVSSRGSRGGFTHPAFPCGPKPHARKEAKKKPAKSLQEKRAAKRKKKQSRGFQV